MLLMRGASFGARRAEPATPMMPPMRIFRRCQSAITLAAASAPSRARAATRHGQEMPELLSMSLSFALADTVPPPMHVTPRHQGYHHCAATSYLLHFSSGLRLLHQMHSHCSRRARKKRGGVASPRHAECRERELHMLRATMLPTSAAPSLFSLSEIPVAIFFMPSIPRPRPWAMLPEHRQVDFRRDLGARSDRRRDIRCARFQARRCLRAMPPTPPRRARRAPMKKFPLAVYVFRRMPCMIFIFDYFNKVYIFISIRRRLGRETRLLFALRLAMAGQ